MENLIKSGQEEEKQKCDEENEVEILAIIRQLSVNFNYNVMKII